MIKSSVGQKVKIVFSFIIFGFGFGGLVALGFVMAKKLPDTFESVMMVATPIAIPYILYKVYTSFNQIEINDHEVIFTTILGKKHRYSKEQTNFSGSIGGFTINQQPFAPTLEIKATPEIESKEKKFICAIYNKEQIEEIKNLLFQS